MVVNNNVDLYRYCTSVGVYEGYSRQEKAHIVTMRMPDSAVRTEEERFVRYYLDEYQFMVWLVCHATIISEDDMYEAVSELWSECDVYPKKPIIKCYRELKEMKLLAMSQAEENELSLYELSTRIQPYVISVSDSIRTQRSLNVLKNAIINTIKSVFLPKEERQIFRFFCKNKERTFFDYIRNENMLQNGNYLSIGMSIKSLLQKGYMCPVGWSLIPTDF